MAAIRRRSVTSFGRTWLSIIAVRAASRSKLGPLFHAQNSGSCAPGALSIRTNRRNAPELSEDLAIAPPATGPSEASWRSGDAEDCKSLHPGSIPGEASSLPYFQRSPPNSSDPVSVNLSFTEAGDGVPVFP